MRRAVIWLAALLAVAVAAAAARRPAAEALYERGLAARREQRFDDARTRFGLALRLAPGLLPARLELARAQQDLGDLRAAGATLEPLLAVDGGDPSLRGAALVAAGRNLQAARQPEDALERFEEALVCARQAGDRRLEARALLRSAGVLYAALDELDAARERLERALGLARELGDGVLEADVLSSLGVYYWWYRRERERPLDELFRPALELYRRADDSRGVADAVSRIGLIHMARRDYGVAARDFETSRELYERIGDRIGLSRIHSYLGALYAGLESYPRARDHYAKSRELCEAAGDLEGCSHVESLIADLHLRRGEPGLAIAALDRLIADPGAPATATRNHLVTRGHALLHLGRPGAARDSYRKALDVARRTPGSDAPFRAQTLTMLAHAHMQSGDADDAAASLARAEAIPIAAKGWGNAVLHTLARADLAAGQGRPREALGHLLSAAEIENGTFGAGRELFFQTQYRQVFDRLFSLLIEGVLVKDAAEKLTFRFLEQMRYRTFRSVVVRLAEAPGSRRAPSADEQAAVERIERLTRQLDADAPPVRWRDLRAAYADYEDLVLRAELAAPRYRLVAAARPVELEVLQGVLAPDAAVVEYVLAGERVFALIVTRGGIESVVLPIETSRLEPKVKLFRALVFGASGEDWRPLAAELDRLLIAPLEESGALGGVGTLVLVPMGCLHELPFAALLSGDGAALVERYAVARAPSATLWTRPRPARASSSRAIVAFGLRRPRGRRLPPLAFAEREAAAVAAVFGGEARVGRDATETAFKALAPGARRLHVAAHGVSEPLLPLHSRLHLEPGSADDGQLTVREILDLDLAADLVSLSACRTGLSPPAGGRRQLEVDRVGFVEAFLHAGAGSVLATLLPVSDAAAAAFMTAFYGHLRSSPPAAALAATQREMLAGAATAAADDGGDAPAVLDHPRYWAPFVLVAGARREPR